MLFGVQKTSLIAVASLSAEGNGMRKNTDEQLNTDFESNGLQFEELDYGEETTMESVSEEGKFEIDANEDYDLRWSEDVDDLPGKQDVALNESYANEYMDPETERVVEEAVAEAKAAKDEEDTRKITGFIKILSMMIFAFVVFIFASIAWFTMNEGAGTGGMGVSSASDPYQIVPLDGNTSIYQEYYNYMSGNQDGSMVWKITADNNMENDTGDDGISPGTYGTISFYVKPRDASVNLDLSFEITGYKYTETTQAAEEEGEDPVITKTMTPVSNELQGYLAGHIFLFETRTPVYDDPESENKKIISYMYSDPILSTTDITKVISNRTFNKTDENTPVNIYWVWPKTLSTLVDATANSYVTIEPFCESSAYTAVVNNVTSYPARFLYRYSDTETTLTDILISSQYETYGDLYDRADNEIGLNVSYITLKMTSTEATQTTP